MTHAILNQVLDAQHAAQPVCTVMSFNSNEVSQTRQYPLLGIAWDALCAIPFLCVLNAVMVISSTDYHHHHQLMYNK